MLAPQTLRPELRKDGKAAVYDPAAVRIRPEEKQRPACFEPEDIDIRPRCVHGLCAAEHDGFVCTLKCAHEGDHEAWGTLKNKPYRTWAA